MNSMNAEWLYEYSIAKQIKNLQIQLNSGIKKIRYKVFFLKSLANVEPAGNVPR